MENRIEFLLSGSGGQGVISAGIILAAAAVADDKYAIQSQSYGPEARGGASRAEVVISNDPIDYPKAVKPKYILCLTDESFRLYGETADESTVVFVDEYVSLQNAKREAISIPIIKTAQEINPQGANVVAVGFLVAYTDVVKRESVRESLKVQFPKFVEKNMACLEAGFGFGDKLKK